jgi:ribonuclease BN (tRNA processing enzyme)
MALKVVFLTHLHADHNLGVLDLIKKRIELIKRKNLPIN